MEPSYWHQRWAEGRTGWHQSEPNRLLERHWASLKVPPGSRVFVPLCGKSLDMAWLAAQGHEVLGVELSRSAVEDFFAGQGLAPEVNEDGRFRRYRAQGIELLVGDAFALTADDLAGCRAAYDRAALIALPPALRERYVRELYARLPAGCMTLLITLEYPPGEKEGPPFSVDEAEVHRLFEPGWQITLEQRVDILDREPSFREEGVTRLHTTAYRLRKRLG
jgi:thiopurine S-methyltransferase